MLQGLIELLILMIVTVGLPVVGLVVLYKVACGALAGAEGHREEAAAERKEAEGDALRLQMLRDKRARRQVEQPAPQPDPTPVPPPQVVFVVPPDPEPERPRVRVIPRALPEKSPDPSTHS